MLLTIDNFWSFLVFVFLIFPIKISTIFFKSSFYHYSQYFSSTFLSHSIFHSFSSPSTRSKISPRLTLPPIFLSNVSLFSLLLDSQYSTIFRLYFIRFWYSFSYFPLSTRSQFHYFDDIFSTIPSFFFTLYFPPFAGNPSPISFLIFFFLHFYPFLSFHSMFSLNFSLSLSLSLIRNIVYSLPFTRSTCNPLKQPRHDERAVTHTSLNRIFPYGCGEQDTWYRSNCEEATIRSRQIT